VGEVREQRSAQWWQQGEGGVRVVESSEASLVVGNSASACRDSRCVCFNETRGALMSRLEHLRFIILRSHIIVRP
jgi:hypothetical protein